MYLSSTAVPTRFFNGQMSVYTAKTTGGSDIGHNITRDKGTFSKTRTIGVTITLLIEKRPKRSVYLHHRDIV
jgi:hypothetical protein